MVYSNLRYNLGKFSLSWFNDSRFFCSFIMKTHSLGCSECLCLGHFWTYMMNNICCGRNWTWTSSMKIKCLTYCTHCTFSGPELFILFLFSIFFWEKKRTIGQISLKNSCIDSESSMAQISEWRIFVNTINTNCLQ